ncbi:MAG: hypothetical protein WBA67_07250 [Jannaschia sp.]
MLQRLDHFLKDDSGAVTLDWVVLTAALVGTGLSVVATVRGGIETVSVETADQMRGQVIRSSFGADETCVGGIAALQAREDQRVAASGGTAIDIAAWMDTYHSGLGDEDILEEHARLSTSLGSGSTWSRDRTIMTALECEMVLRGLD